MELQRTYVPKFMWLPLAMLLTFPAINNGYGEGYEVEGNVQFHFYDTQKPQTSLPIHFTITVNDCRWSIIFNRDDPNGSDYQQVTYDGRDQYQLSTMMKMIERAKKEGKTFAGGNVANAIVKRGEIFHNRFSPEVGTIWLAYGSGCFFRSLNTNYMEPPLASDGVGWVYDQPTPRKLLVQRDMFSDPLSLPSLVVFFDDGVNMVGNKRQPPPYDKGFTNSIFSVDSVTNVGTLSVPASSSLKLYRPRTGGRTSTDLNLFAEYRISLKDFRLTAQSVAGIPALPGATMVFDARIPEAPNLLYPTTNKWPSTVEIEANPDFQAKVVKFGPIASVHRITAKAAVVKAIFALLLLIPLVLLLRKFIRRNNPNTQTQKERQ